MLLRNVLAAIAAGIIASAASASATVVAFGQPGFPAVTVAPGGFIQAYYSNDANSDIGNQSPSTVEAVMESWFGHQLNFAGGGSCGASPSYSNNCTAYDNGGGNSQKGGISNLTAQLFAVHFGNRFIAFLYSGPTNGFRIDGLRYGVSNIYAFDGASPVPIPGAVWLMGAGLAGISFAARKKRY